MTIWSMCRPRRASAPVCRMLAVSRLLFLLVSLLALGCGDDRTTKPDPGDTTPPAAIANLAVNSPPGLRVTLVWNAPGDDGVVGQAVAYDLRYASRPLTEASWDSAMVITAVPDPRAAGAQQSVTIRNLPYGIWHFAMKTADEVPNWSALSNEVSATVADLVAPSAVVNLMVSYTTARAATLSWTAPGNDGMSGEAAEYDLRYALATITMESWDAATRVEGLPTPAAPGVSEAFTVTGLENGQTFFFALKTADDAGNWSALSNVPSAQVVDYMAPAQVADLTVWATAPQSATLGWTAPGNNGTVGRAVEYDLRYSLEEIRDVNWEGATRVADVPAPDTAGAAESFTVTGLQPGQLYYFALRTADEVPNWSTASNAAIGTVSSARTRRLTRSPADGVGASNPSWSPDGQTILFEANWTTDYYVHIHSVAASGGSPVQLTNGIEDICPAWSPDGSHLAFIGARNGINAQEIWTMNPNPGATATLVLQEDQNLSGCEWSPDGSRIAYRKYSTSPWGSVIRMVPVNGGGATTLVDDATMPGDPAWSPDGTRIAFHRHRPDTGTDIWVLPVDGGDAVQLTDDTASDSGPVWSPDGSRILFISGRGGTADFWTMSPDGEDLTRLTTGLESGYQPVWSPNGREIAYTDFKVLGGRPRQDIWILELE
jgi:Tol biopolymer transport system component